MITRHDLAHAANQSIDELRIHGHTPTQLRMHPLDIETILADIDPASAGEQMHTFMGLPVVADPGTRLGEPVAELQMGGDAL